MKVNVTRLESFSSEHGGAREDHPGGSTDVGLANMNANSDQCFSEHGGAREDHPGGSTDVGLANMNANSDQCFLGQQS
jgi:hypothetical protein